jgi:hypothetical protein
VGWDELAHTSKPLAPIRFENIPSGKLSITPVVFITNETLQHATVTQMDTLAANIVRLLSSIAITNKLSLSNEVQIDCDWAAGTKEKYFYLLKNIRQQSFLNNKTLSATRRLHQLKFISTSGIPPVDKGLLMYYNMGNLRQPQTKNSILDVDEAEKYITNVSSYPLPLDVALPLFDWYVWFHQGQYKGLIHTFELENTSLANERIQFDKDTTVNGFTFEKGDWLRYEGSATEEIKEAAKSIRRKLRQSELTLIFYHLDSANLINYKPHELEAIYNSFR